jgi:hypothetical protein
MDSSQAQLIGEQLNHLRDNINARLDHLENLIQHKAQLDAEQKAAMRTELADLREICRDHETRLRDVASGVTQFRFMIGGASLASVAALVKAFLP